MLKNAYLLAKISADTAENERNFAKNLPKKLATTLPLLGDPGELDLRRHVWNAAREVLLCDARASSAEPDGKTYSVPAVFSQLIYSVASAGCSRKHQLASHRMLRWIFVAALIYAFAVFICTCEKSFDYLDWLTRDPIGRSIHNSVSSCPVRPKKEENVEKHWPNWFRPAGFGKAAKSEQFLNRKWRKCVA